MLLACKVAFSYDAEQETTNGNDKLIKPLPEIASIYNPYPELAARVLAALLPDQGKPR